jgi:serpin B
MSMLLIIPDRGKFQEFEKSLSASLLQSIIHGMQSKRLDLSMPRFKIESKFSLAKILSEMGMPIAFTGGADFSGMTGSRDLAISDVIHQAFVDVDESGTEAAAATAVVMRLTATPEMPITVKVDRPFIFLIRDLKTDAVIFIGRVINPGM